MSTLKRMSRVASVGDGAGSDDKKEPHIVYPPGTRVFFVHPQGIISAD